MPLRRLVLEDGDPSISNCVSEITIHFEDYFMF